MAKNLAAETILFVDDEESILNALRRELIDEEYRCLFALSGAQALKIMENEDVSVIVSDMKMPEIDGLRLLKLAKEKYPQIVRIVLSGYTQLPQILVTINQAEVFKFLTKPWGSELKSVILQAIGYHQLQEERDKFEQLLNLKYDETTSILEKIENVILAARNGNRLFAEMGMMALEMAAEALDTQEKRIAAKKQLSLASSLLLELSKMDFEEYSDIETGLLCEAIKLMLMGEHVSSVDIEAADTLPTVKTRYKALSQFINAVIRELTKAPHGFHVELKPHFIESELPRKFELTCMVSPVGGQTVPESDYEEQQAYVDMLNVFAARILSLLGGGFQGMITKGIVILKIAVKDYSK